MRLGAAVAPLALLALGCGRLDFEANDGGRGSTLDPTICDELASALVCEGWEGPRQLATDDANAPSYVRTDGEHAYRGQLALHSHTEVQNVQAWQRGHKLGGRVSGDLWARYYTYVHSAAGIASLTAIHLLSDVTPFDGVIWGATATQIEIDATETDMTGSTSAVFPRDRWVCVQIHIVIDAAAGLVETWLDGAPSSRLDALDTLPPTGYWNIHTGHFSSSATADVLDVWTDELVVSTTEVPCD